MALAESLKLNNKPTFKTNGAADYQGSAAQVTNFMN